MRASVPSFLVAGVAVAAGVAALNAGGVDAPGCAEAQAQTGRAVEGRLDCRTACLATARIPAASVRRRGSGLRFSFRRNGVRRVRVDLLRFARGRTLQKPRRVRSFGARRRAFTAKRLSLPGGTYVARFRAGRQRRLVVLRKRRGRLARRPTYARPKGCDFLSALRLSAPAFTKRGVRIRYRLAQPARVSIVVRRGRRVVKRFRTRRRAPGRTHRLRLRGARRGIYRVSIVARGATRTVRATVAAERL